MTRSRALLLILVPAAPFLLVALAAAVGWMPDPYLYLHGDVVAVAVAFAALLAGHVGFLLWRGWAGRRRVRRAITQTRDTAIEQRGKFIRRLHHGSRSPSERCATSWPTCGKRRSTPPSSSTSPRSRPSSNESPIWSSNCAS